ncbi:MAG: DUF2799 domain-containing protein [Pseudobdellovibrionaceae bacterium]|mgnify:CR=1 FL=1|nr:DUF2799 domain-containing protein [Bdellovibrionales bacterium]USN47572.1 MAG: DUF2799 domain-containing protein [Pseudobdellovibrionaceae bacterium]
MKSLVLFISLLILIGTTGCGSTPLSANCQEPDWYELGRRQGFRGLEPKWTEVTASCPQSSSETISRLYENGYNAGLAKFCTPENGFNRGRTGQPLVNICPSVQSLAFQRAYERGERVLRLEATQRQLGQNINLVLSKLNDRSLSDQEKQALFQQKTELENTLAGNEKQIQRLRIIN